MAAAKGRTPPVYDFGVMIPSPNAYATLGTGSDNIIDAKVPVSNFSVTRFSGGVKSEPKKHFYPRKNTCFDFTWKRLFQKLY